MKHILCCFAITLAELAFGLALPLSVKNSLSTVDRIQVPVQMGIPFPQGKLTLADLPKLTLSDSLTSQAIPAGITAASLWHDSSIRWVRLLFPATVSSSSRKSYLLTDANINPDGGLQAVEQDNRVTVITGPLKFIVKGDNFNLIDEAWINESAPGDFNDANRIVTANNDGGFFIRIASTSYSSNTTTGKVTLLEKTGYHAIVKVTGKVDRFAYTVYIYAYAGKPYIKVVHRFYYDITNGTPDSLKSIKDIALILKSSLQPDSVRFSRLSGDTGAILGRNASDTAMLCYDNVDHYTIQSGSDTLNAGVGMNGAGVNGPADIGWGLFSNGNQGIAGAIRFMWQMAPKNITFTGDGGVGLHLYSHKGPALFFYGGAGRTHFTGFSFSKSKAMAKEMFYAITQPLYAAAPTKWLSAQTRVMGNLSPCEAPAFNETIPGMLSQYRNMGTIHGHADRKLVVNGEHSYGFLQFGDLSDPPEACGGGTSRHWSNNYYDFPHCIAQAYMITSSEANIETGLAHAIHMMDMDHSSVTGQSRTCPGYGIWGDYNTCGIAYSTTANHYKCQGIFDWANILSEPILGEVGLKIAQWASTYPSGQVRAVGHSLEALSAAYAYTNDPTWKSKLMAAYTRYSIMDIVTNNDQGTYQPFQQGYTGEGIIWTLFEIPTFQTALDALKKWADYWSSLYTTGDPDYGYFIGLSGACDFTPANDTLYKRVLSDMWSNYTATTGIGNTGAGRLKSLTLGFKAPPHYFHWVKKEGYNPLLPDYASLTASVIGIEKKTVKTSFTPFLHVTPNPFHANTRIEFGMWGTGKTTVPVRLLLFNVSGQEIKRLALSPKALGECHSIDLSCRFLPAGVYILKLRMGDYETNQKLVLAR